MPENPQMDISKVISANLVAWMRDTPSLDTLKKVAAKSGVGFGTVQRAKNGDGNLSIEKLTMIAAAFRRHPAELLKAPIEAYEVNQPAAPNTLVANDSATITQFPNGPLNDLMDLARRMNDTGLNQLIGAARILAEQYPKADRGNAAS